MTHRSRLAATALGLALASACAPGLAGPAGDGGAGDGGGLPGGGGGGAAGGGAAAYLADPVVSGRVLRVCPAGCPYAKPSLAAAAAVDGDTIEVAPGDYVDCAVLTSNQLVVRGLSGDGGVRPHLHSQVCGRKGILVVQGASVLLENLELSDAVDPTGADQNWACIRLDSLAGARDLLVRGCACHDADDGLLGNDVSTAPNTVLVEDSLFERLGRAGYAHGLYLGTAVDLFVLRNSTVRSNHDDGHLVKSRARRSILECNTLAALEGPSSYGVDLPQGGQVVLRDNVLQAGPRLSNPGNLMVTFGEESGANAPHALTLTGNTLVDDHPAPGRVNVAVPADTGGWSGNRYVGPGGAPVLVGADGGAASFTGFLTRAAAGLPAYDGGPGSLPSPPRCP